jgi:hypothetical protein
MFKHDRAEWKRSLDKQQKKRELFVDLLGAKQEGVESPKDGKSKKRGRNAEENNEDGFYIDTQGERDSEAKKEPDIKEVPVQKKAKKKVKSYLDDL